MDVIGQELFFFLLFIFIFEGCDWSRNGVMALLIELCPFWVCCVLFLFIFLALGLELCHLVI